MQATTARLYHLGYTDMRTYLVVGIFALGNIALPQLFHLVPQGGVTWLPIYFFTLIGAYKYGWKVGLLTALLSPVANSALFGMPHADVLPAILLKSTLLAIAAGYLNHRYAKATLPLLLLAILFYQVVGTLGEWCIGGNLRSALQDFRIGMPGMALQLFGGWTFINYIIKK